jgi:hypothetical protein
MKLLDSSLHHFPLLKKGHPGHFARCQLEQYASLLLHTIIQSSIPIEVEVGYSFR